MVAVLVGVLVAVLVSVFVAVFVGVAVGRDSVTRFPPTGNPVTIIGFPVEVPVPVNPPAKTVTA